MIPVLMTFAAISVDVGGWNTRAAQLQRGADAAALAAVVWMPDFATAQQVALDTAAKNGFTNGVNDITITTTSVAGNSHQVQVTISDASADQFFSRFLLDRLAMSRSATAEYLLPLPL